MEYAFSDETVLALSAREPQAAVLSVSDVTGIIKDLLETSLSMVTVEGEISNWKPSSSGHIYFTLKDEASCLQAVMFKSSAARLSFQPAEGDKVQAKGRITVYGARGQYQIVVSSMEMAGSGNILKMLEERRRRLAMEGLFDEANKRPLPYFAETIGVVTSPTGAALRDIINVTRRRNPKATIIVLPCAVQGAEAAPQISAQIAAANAWHLCDVLIVGRGGGSLEDLLPFSEECVVRAVAASEIPVVSAVGHEIDWAISDYAADKRAPTPSAAAELCSPVLSDILYNLGRIKDDLKTTMEGKVTYYRNLARVFDRETLELQFRAIEQPLLSRFDNAKDALSQNMVLRMKDARSRLERKAVELHAINPLAVLDRGFSLVRDSETGAIIRSGNQVQPGAVLEIMPKEGHIKAQVLAGTTD